MACTSYKWWVNTPSQEGGDTVYQETQAKCGGEGQEFPFKKKSKEIWGGM